MKLFVGVTDSDWFELLRSQPSLEAANFWQPGGSRQFRAIEEGELFLFKLHAPRIFIGGGVFFRSFLAPLSLAWEAFGIRNGARTPQEMRARSGINSGQVFRRPATIEIQPSAPRCLRIGASQGITRDSSSARRLKMWVIERAVAPHAYVAMWNAVQVGDHKTALDWHNRLLSLWNAIWSPNMCACVKFAQELQGCAGAYPRAPMPAASSAQQDAIRHAMKAVAAKRQAAA